MKSNLLIAGGLLLTSVVTAEEAPNAASGQKLFNESRCLECHGVDIFTNKDRQVQDLGGLESTVRLCDTRLSTNWYDDQILDVVAYLNKVYYKFDTASQQSSAGSAEIDAEKKVVVANTESN